MGPARPGHVRRSRSLTASASPLKQPDCLISEILKAHALAVPPEPPTVDRVVGGTPLVRLQRLTAATPDTRIYVKLEGSNPGGSAKDRPAIAMLDAAEASGVLRPGSRVVEATSGNTGIALAMACAARGYKLTIIMPSNATAERRAAVQAFGADIELVDGPLERGLEMARAMAAAGKAVMLDQNNNAANPLSHYNGTGAEIWTQTGGSVTHFVAGMGTSGTLSGVSRALKARNPHVTAVGVEPPAADPGAIPGMRIWAPEHQPCVRDDGVIDEVMEVTLREAEETARALARTEGLLLGPSAAAAISAALRLAATPEGRGATIVVLACDRGDRYLSTGMFSLEAGAQDPKPCPSRELPSVLARCAAGAYPAPHFVAFPAAVGAECEAAVGAAMRDGHGQQGWKLLEAARELAEALGGTLVEVHGEVDWSDPALARLMRSAATMAAGGNAPVLVQVARHTDARRNSVAAAVACACSCSSYSARICSCSSAAAGGSVCCPAGTPAVRAKSTEQGHLQARIVLTQQLLHLPAKILAVQLGQMAAWSRLAKSG